METLQFAATRPARTHLSGWLLIILAILAAAVWLTGYSLACYLWPFTACNRCGGDGKRRSPSGKRFGDCRRCRGTGRQVRLGRRFLNWLYRTTMPPDRHHNGPRPTVAATTAGRQGTYIRDAARSTDASRRSRNPVIRASRTAARSARSNSFTVASARARVSSYTTIPSHTVGDGLPSNAGSTAPSSPCIQPSTSRIGRGDNASRTGSSTLTTVTAYSGYG